MTFKEIKTPEQLMKYLDQNFKYGVIDKKGTNIITATPLNSSVFAKHNGNCVRLKQC